MSFPCLYRQFRMSGGEGYLPRPGPDGGGGVPQGTYSPPPPGQDGGRGYPKVPTPARSGWGRGYLPPPPRPRTCYMVGSMPLALMDFLAQEDSLAGLAQALRRTFLCFQSVHWGGGEVPWPGPDGGYPKVGTPIQGRYLPPHPDMAGGVPQGRYPPSKVGTPPS